MKYILFLAFALFFTTSLNGQGQAVQPIQIQTIDTSTYVVEYIPLATAQANVKKQIEQTDKQIAKIESEIAKLVAQRDKLMQQKAALEVVAKQLDEAAAPPPPATQSATDPKKTTKPKKKKD